MCINWSKISIVSIKYVELLTENIKLSDGSIIYPVKLDEPIKYLRISFIDYIVFDKKQLFINLEKDIRNLVTSPFLRGDQKVNIIDQYVYPKLVYLL